MKKLIITSLTAALLLTASHALAAVSNPNDASHELEITIPEVLMIRIDASDNSSVIFDYGTDFNQYFDLLEDGSSGTLPPTTKSFENISVFANYEHWVVSVTAKGHELVTERVTVAPTNPSTYLGTTEFKLDGNEIAKGTQTQGWQPLGISGNDYLLYVDGTETPGEYNATITYSITAP